MKSVFDFQFVNLELIVFEHNVEDNELPLDIRYFLSKEHQYCSLVMA